MCLDLPAPLPSYKHVQVADAAASSPLRLWSSNTAASKPAAAREGGTWAADTDLEASAEMWRFRPGPWTAPQHTRVPWGSWVGLPTGEQGNGKRPGGKAGARARGWPSSQRAVKAGPELTQLIHLFG